MVFDPFCYSVIFFDIICCLFHYCDTISCMNISIVLEGDVPSKKNSKQIIYRYGRPMIISSKRFIEWNKVAQQIMSLKYRGLKASDVECITMTIFPSTKRKSDLSNKFESIADLLVDVGVIEDDNWFVVPKVVMLFGGVDKKNPRVEVEILTLAVDK